MGSTIKQTKKNHCCSYFERKTPGDKSQGERQKRLRGMENVSCLLNARVEAMDQQSHEVVARRVVAWQMWQPPVQLRAARLTNAVPKLILFFPGLTGASHDPTRQSPARWEALGSPLSSRRVPVLPHSRHTLTPSLRGILLKSTVPTCSLTCNGRWGFSSLLSYIPHTCLEQHFMDRYKTEIMKAHCKSAGTTVMNVGQAGASVIKWIFKWAAACSVGWPSEYKVRRSFLNTSCYHLIQPALTKC